MHNLFIKYTNIFKPADFWAWLLLYISVLTLLSYASVFIEKTNQIIEPDKLTKFTGIIKEVDINGRLLHGRRGKKDPIITVCNEESCKKFYFEIFIHGRKEAEVLHAIKTPVTVYYQPDYKQLRPPFKINALWAISSTPKVEIAPYTEVYLNLKKTRNGLFEKTYSWLMASSTIISFLGFWARLYLLTKRKPTGVTNGS